MNDNPDSSKSTRIVASVPLPGRSGDSPYNERDFIVPAADQRGHSERIWARVSPGLRRQMSVIFESRVFPYPTEADMVRHAITRHLAWLEQQVPVPSVMAQVRLIDSILVEEQFHQDFILIMDRIEQQVARHVAGGRMLQAQRLLRDILDKIEAMPPGEWQSRYREAAQEKFKHLLKETGG